jgi:hypothetical protein
MPRRPHSGRVIRRILQSVAFAATIAACALAGEMPAPSDAAAPPGSHFAQVTVEPTKTSIYVGSVSLTMPPFSRLGGAYTAGYRAKVFPFFFYSERGDISVEFPDESLHRLMAGETVYFRGHANNSRGVERRIEGRAIPDKPGADHGKIKVRVWVGKIELIFNTVYRFTGRD